MAPVSAITKPPADRSLCVPGKAAVVPSGRTAGSALFTGGPWIPAPENGLPTGHGHGVLHCLVAGHSEFGIVSVAICGLCEWRDVG